jgi:homeobox protein cut-like
LETQVSDLEAETEQLSRALEQQRTVSAEIEATASKKVEEFSRELQKKVTLAPITH